MTQCLAQQLTTARKKQKKSQEEIARLVNVSVRTVARWEKKAFKPSPLARQQIQKALELLQRGQI